jgi:hypothetical protein
VLTYTADQDEPATWKILQPGPGGTEDLYGTQRFATRTPRGSRPGSDPSWAMTTPPKSLPLSTPHHRHQPAGIRRATPADYRAGPGSALALSLRSAAVETDPG